jgi:nucleotide-binding universal stress UspA family protein
MWQRILVPLDGSNLAELAIPYAEELAAAFSSEVVLLYVSEPAESQYRRMHQLYIEEMGGQMREKIKKVSPLVLTGKPAEEIIGYAEKNDISLIIITSHGRSGILSWATGSVTNKVLHATGVPLLLIRATRPPRKVPQKHLLERILLPLDGSAAGEAAVPYAQEIMVRLGSEVILFGVVPAGQHIRTVGGLDYILYPEEQLGVFKTEAGEYLGKVYRQLKGRKGTVRVELKVGDKSGDIAREIIKFAEENEVSLIAISSHGHSGIERWVFGSIANKVVQASEVPVLMVRAVGAKT